MSAKAVIDQVLAESIKDTKQREDLVELIERALSRAGYLWEDGWVETVEVRNARAAVGRVQVYGLVIELDAHGDAVTVNSPYGFTVIE